VLACDAEARAGEQPVDVGGGSPADDRQSAAGRAAERLQQAHQSVVDGDVMRVVGDVEQGAVEVEKERAAPFQHGRPLEPRLGRPHRAFRDQ